MYIIACIAWILMWGAAGYFTVRAICTHIATKRMQREFMMYTNTHPWMRVASKEES
jgi:hypothetical protein